MSLRAFAAKQSPLYWDLRIQEDYPFMRRLLRAEEHRPRNDMIA